VLYDRDLLGEASVREFVRRAAAAGAVDDVAAAAPPPPPSAELEVRTRAVPLECL